MRRILASVAAALAIAIPACTQGAEDEPTPLPTEPAVATPTPGTGPVEVTLGEWSVLPDPEAVTAGEIEFQVKNDGKELHEFVVIDTDLDPEDLPTADDGSLDEEQLDVLDEIEDIEAGEGGELKLELDSGTYLLACNVVETEDDGTVEAHFKLGMRTAFTVA